MNTNSEVVHCQTAEEYQFPPGGRETLTCLAFLNEQPRTAKKYRIDGLLKEVIRNWSGCFTIYSEHVHRAAEILAKAERLELKNGKININVKELILPSRDALWRKCVDISPTNVRGLQQYASRIISGGGE